MIINEIIASCPKCKKEFKNAVLVTSNSVSESKVDPKDELFSAFRTCPHCKEKFNIYNDGHGKPRFYFIPRKYSKIRDWIKSFIP